jgi:hypothetical protein
VTQIPEAIETPAPARAWAGKRSFVVLGIVGVLVYLVIVDLGISAGRIHHGVAVAGIDLAGLTESEAVARLNREVEEKRTDPVVFQARELRFLLLPADVDWRPMIEASADAAMAVGRQGGPVAALADRVRGWFGGVEVKWTGRPNPHNVGNLIDDVARQAHALDYDLNRGKLRKKVRRAAKYWPDRPLRIPIT